MKKTFLYGSVLIFSLSTLAGGKETLIFEDDFERSESDDTKEEIGKAWTSNSEKRAKGNKQVDLKDGAMHITMHPEADHAVSVAHAADFQNAKITLRFKLPTKEDSLGLNFADLEFKEVHAGHLCMIKINSKSVQINDLKTGVMDKAIRSARAKDQLTPEQKKMLKTKVKKFPHKLKIDEWHTLALTIQDDTMTALINGKEVASFSSVGIAHPTKRTLRVAVPKTAIIDDLKIHSLEK